VTRTFHDEFEALLAPSPPLFDEFDTLLQGVRDFDKLLDGKSWRYRNLEAYRLDRWAPDDDLPIGLSVSGGLSSAYQAAHIVAANGGLPSRLTAHFCNTGREHEETLKFVDRLDREFGLDLVYLECDRQANTGVRVVDYASASRGGEPFLSFLYEEIKRRDGTIGVRPLSNPAQRTCTDQLKAKTWHRYARRHLGWSTRYYTVLGYRADEPKRYNKRVKRDANGFKETGKGLSPMYHAGVDSDAKEMFWLCAPFTLGISSKRGNCDFCFMLAEWNIKERMLEEMIASPFRLRDYKNGVAPIPPRIMFWIAAEERVSDRPGVFRKDRPTYRQIWEAVLAGNMEGSKKGDVCRDCGG